MGKVTGHENGGVGSGPSGVDPQCCRKGLDFTLWTVNKVVMLGELSQRKRSRGGGVGKRLGIPAQ